MGTLRDELEEADELLEQADGKLHAAAKEIEQVAAEHSTLDAHQDIEDGTITLSVNHQVTVKKLNGQLPYPYYAKEKRGKITVSELEVDIEEDELYNLKQLVGAIEDQLQSGAPEKAVLDKAEDLGYTRADAEHELDKLKQKGEVYTPYKHRLRTT